MPAFDGFSPQLLTFLRALGRNNNKKWFDDHRAEYDSLYLEPAKDFAAAMGSALKALGPDVRSEPRVNGSIMRINRDVRFSKDKTPYKTALHFIFSAGQGSRNENPAYYLRLAADELGLAAGLFGFDAGQLATYRQAVVDPKLGPALRRAVDKVCKADSFELNEPGYKRVPRGLDAEHRNAEFLKMKGLFAHTELEVPKAILSKDAVPYVIDRFKEMKPIPVWLARAFAR